MVARGSSTANLYEASTAVAHEDSTLYAADHAFVRVVHCKLLDADDGVVIINHHEANAPAISGGTVTLADVHEDTLRPGN